MNKEKIIDGIILFGIIATVAILIFIACIILDIAPEVKDMFLTL